MIQATESASKRTVLAIGTVCAASLAALGDFFTAVRADPVPIRQDLPEAVQKARAAAKPGDIFVHSPLFTGSELSALDDLQATPQVPSPKTLTARRVVVIDRRSSPMYLASTPHETQRVGSDLEIRVYEPKSPGTMLRYDLYANLESARMEVVRPGHTASCELQRSEGGQACSGEPEWLYLARRELVIGGQPAPCVWAHPTTDGTIRVTLPPQEGTGLTLELEAAITDDAATTPDGASVTTRALQAGVEIGRVTVPNARGFFRTRVGLKSTEPVVLEITTPRDGRRHHCINARIHEGSP